MQIARPRKPVFIGGDDLPETMQRYVSNHSIPCFHYASRAIIETDNGWGLRLVSGNAWIDLPPPSIPRPNAALAIQVWESAAEQLGIESWQETVAHVLSKTKIFGRMTTWRENPETILDAAHNPAAAALLAETLQALPKKTTTAIVGIMADKDVAATLTPLLGLINSWLLWPLDNPRAMQPLDLRSVLEQLGVRPDRISVVDSNQPLTFQNQQRYLVFGSFFTLESFVLTFPQT